MSQGITTACQQRDKIIVFLQHNQMTANVSTHQALIQFPLLYSKLFFPSLSQAARKKKTINPMLEGTWFME
jgi:hypothetical protein